MTSTTVNPFKWFGLEPEKFNGMITGFGPIDWLLQPLREVAWNYGYTAGEYDAGKVSWVACRLRRG
ncbi:MAG: hypothetical protein OXFUSZZB_002424 [Candidatus Fervidibacter sp.]|jgi:hypothetical protein